MAEVFDWLKPSPLWSANGLDFRQPDFFQPALFGFHSDAFMEEFLAAAAAPQPAALGQSLATPAAGQALKLFQPVHGNFYLVCGSLCCRQPGFPDRQVRAADGESTFFVLRKLIAGEEYAWVAEGGQKGWNVANRQANGVLPNEERLPLFPTVAGNGRTLLFGYLPVASRETYNVAPAQLAAMTGDPLSSIADGRVENLRSRFADQVPVVINASFPNETVSRTVSVYLLLELWEYLDTPGVLPDVAVVIRGDPGATLSADKTAQKQALLDFLATQTLGGGLTLRTALREVAKKQSQLDESDADPLQLGFSSNYNLKTFGGSLDTDTLVNKVESALPDGAQPPFELPKLDTAAGAEYVLRCVYERPQCDPPQVTVSKRSVRLQLAPFFDPDAPARPVKIPLPTNISPARLRKFNKNVTFQISNELQKKINSLTGNERAMLQDPPAAGPETDDGFAFICSFSIEIIFIVAFFLLLMFVIILNFVFWWIAFFKICLPVPKKLLPG